MSNQTNQTSPGFVPWSLQVATQDDLIFIFICAPVSILGFFLCLSSAIVFSTPEFKEKLFVYLRLNCILMTIDLSITSIRSLAPTFMCRTTNKVCPLQTNLVPVVIDTFIFAYWPSGTEAAALFTDILSSLTCLFMLNQSQNSVKNFIVKLNPKVTVLVAYALFALMFSYQNRIFFDLIAFSIRDGLLLVILLVLNALVAFKVKTSMSKKRSIVANNSSQKATQSAQQRITLLVLVDCINSIVGRVPIFSLFVIRNVNRPLVSRVPLTSLCSLAVFLSYFFKFFIYARFNKRFRLVAYRKLFFFRFFYKRPSVEFETSGNGTVLRTKHSQIVKN